MRAVDVKKFPEGLKLCEHFQMSLYKHKEKCLKKEYYSRREKQKPKNWWSELEGKMMNSHISSLPLPHLFPSFPLVQSHQHSHPLFFPKKPNLLDFSSEKIIVFQEELQYRAATNSQITAPLDWWKCLTEMGFTVIEKDLSQPNDQTCSEPNEGTENKADSKLHQGLYFSVETKKKWQLSEDLQDLNRHSTCHLCLNVLRKAFSIHVLRDMV